MKRFFVATLITWILVAPNYSFAYIYKCVDSNDKVIFSTTPGMGCVILTEFNDNPTHPKWVGQKMDFDFIDTDIKNILLVLSELVGRQIVWGTEIKGKISLKFTNIPWDQALKVMLKPIGLTCHIKGDEVFIIQSSKAAWISGYETMIASDGSKYFGEVKNGLRNGYGMAINPDGSKYEGEWKDDKRHGRATYTFPDGRIYKGEFKNDLFYLHTGPSM